MVLGLQLLSWREIEARSIGGTEGNVSYAMQCESGGKFTPEFATILLECPKVCLAGTEGAAMSDSVVEVHGNEIGDADEGRVPAGALNSAV